MAYMDQEKKAVIVNLIKNQCKANGIKIQLTGKVRHFSTLVLNLKGANIDLYKNHLDTLKQTVEKNKEDHKLTYTQIESIKRCIKDVEEYDPENAQNTHGVNYLTHVPLEYQFTGQALTLMNILIKGVDHGNFDNSDPMTDYFHVGHYSDVYIGANKGGFKVI